MNNNLSYTTEIKPLFNHDIINTFCQMIDIKQSELSKEKIKPLKLDLLHFMRNAYDLTCPLCKEQRLAYDKVCNDL